MGKSTVKRWNRKSKVYGLIRLEESIYWKMLKSGKKTVQHTQLDFAKLKCYFELMTKMERTSICIY